MTALKEYERLEASGLWRASPEEQRREVVVSIGDATLTICDHMDRPLTHWSLAAIQRENPGTFPALYSPAGDPGETLEIAEDETDMLAAIEKLRLAIDRARPRPGRLRMAVVLSFAAVVLGLLVFWLPGALMRHTVSVVPDIQRQAIGRSLLSRIERVAGRTCETADTIPVLAALAHRTGVRKLVILPTGVQDSRHLPGGIVLLNKSLIEDHEDPAVLAGFILSERVRAEESDPLTDMLSDLGLLVSFRLLTTGNLSSDTLQTYAERVLVLPHQPVADEALLRAFSEIGVPSTPYAYARDVTGETVLPLIEADPMAGTSPAPILPDRDWVLLQNICGG